MAEGQRKQHQGWKFRHVDAKKPCARDQRPRTPVARRAGVADEQWARLEPLGDGRLRVTPERRDGTEGAPFVVDLYAFRGASESVDGPGLTVPASQWCTAPTALGAIPEFSAPAFQSCAVAPAVARWILGLALRFPNCVGRLVVLIS